MSPLCPIDTGVQLVPFDDDYNTASGNFWECPVHHGRYVSHGLMGLIPVPRAITSKPPDGYEAIYTLHRNPTTGTILYESESSSEDDNTISGDMTYLELNATNQSAGQLNLVDVNWGESKVKIDYLKITVASGTVTDFDVAIYEKDTFQPTDVRYAAEGLNSTDNWEDDLEWIYIDDDVTKEVHLKITENAGGPGTYSIQFRGVKLV